MTYLLVVNGETGAGIFALSQGLLIDVFSGGLLGLFTLIYLTVFLGINLGSRLFDLRSARGQVIIISLAVLLKGMLLITFLNIFSLEMHISSLGLWAFAASAACSGLIGPLIFYLLNHLKYFLTRGIREALEDHI
jgi:cell shape-determining protein MreD